MHPIFCKIFVRNQSVIHVGIPPRVGGTHQNDIYEMLRPHIRPSLRYFAPSPEGEGFGERIATTSVRTGFAMTLRKSGLFIAIYTHFMHHYERNNAPKGASLRGATATWQSVSFVGFTSRHCPFGASGGVKKAPYEELRKNRYET